MIITKTPFRISLFGGGTDYPAWYRKNGGEVISFAIDKFCYLTTRVLPPFFDHKYRIAYSKVETTRSIEDIQHPAVRSALEKYCPDLSLEIHHDGDLPARSGVGSSSAFAVGLIHSLSVLQNRELSKIELANEAIFLEQSILKENVGSQDQIACALGGFNYIKFGGKNEWTHEPIQISDSRVSEIESRMVLVYTGVQRSSSNIQANLLLNIDSKTKTMERTIELARICREIIESDSDLDQIGQLLIESWSLKKEMNTAAVTNELEEVWSKAKLAGALGGKVLGAGGGGFCLFWIKAGTREEFLKRFNVGTWVPIRITSEGSSCILK